MKVLFQSERHTQAKVAVLVSLYNYAHHIEDALNSVEEQSTEDIELVVCNDCSTDKSVEVTLNWMHAHPDRFSRMALIENDVNSGLAATRNTSVGYALAPYVFILDADNMLYPACLERHLEVMDEADADAAFVYSQREVFYDQSSERALENLPDWNVFLLPQGNYIDAMVLHRKSALVAVGGYTADECFGRLGWEDFELWFKYARKKMYGIQLQQPLIRYRLHGSSMLRTTTNLNKSQKILWETLRERYPDFFLTTQ